MRHLPILCGVLLLAIPAHAQSVATTPANTGAGAAAPAPSTIPRHQTMREHFAEANVTHDGHLTLEQAKAGFPAMARLFDAIDRDHKGYMTMDDIRAYYEARRAARAASN